MKIDVVKGSNDLPDEDFRRYAMSTCIVQASISSIYFYTGTKISTTSVVTSLALDKLANIMLNSPIGIIVLSANKLRIKGKFI